MNDEAYKVDFTTLKKQVRLTVLLDAAEEAGLAPMPVLRLHAFAYLANVLAPVWELPPLEGKVLKRRGGPFYPTLQHDLDRLIGLGVAIIFGVSHVQNEDGHWRLEGSYRLHKKFGKPILNALSYFPEENRMRVFIQEVAFALSALGADEIDRAMLEDATYSDPVPGLGNVIDFAEWKKINYSTNAANAFDRFMPLSASPGNKLHLYVSHLYRRAHGDR